MIISHLAGRPDVWSRLVSPPILVSKGNVMIGYSPVYEYAALPDEKRIIEAVHRVMEGTRPAGAAPARAPGAALRRGEPKEPSSAAPAHGPAFHPADISIRVPLMGEGIRAARIVSLIKKPGERVELDEPLCEVETDKAVYPIESSMAGVLKEWRCKVDDVLEIGREIAVMTVEGAAAAAPARNLSMQQLQQQPPASGGTPVAPALSPAITRRLTGVVPVNMQLDVQWRAIRLAREAAKRMELQCTPSLMLAWVVARAMTRHPAFRRLTTKDRGIVERDPFDLGVAVALDGDQLATAVIREANRLDWAAFASVYAQAVASARAGKVDDVQAPLIITSLGGFGIEVATPIVVPPSMGTLFVGKAHERVVNEGGAVYPAEVVTLSLTFDHKVVNGAGAAAFLHDIKVQAECFSLPA
jgi:pyruvate/2-oxoglutarate dehydrogenase complex dihydrolipoamide acyltransferase (E2) component